MTHPPDDTFGRRLKRLLKKRGLSCRAFARQSGVSAPTVLHLAADRCEPRLSTLLAVSRALQVSLAFWDDLPEKNRAAP